MQITHSVYDEGNPQALQNAIYRHNALICDGCRYSTAVLFNSFSLFLLCSTEDTIMPASTTKLQEAEHHGKYSILLFSG